MTEVTVRRARPDDLDFLLALVNHADVEPYLGGRASRTREALLDEIERSERDPAAFGRFVIDADGQPAGTMDFVRANERSRIARVGGFAVDPRFRGRGVGVEAARRFARHLLLDLDFHRLELEIYGFNERALRHAERAGFVREGVRRKAYRRNDQWVDGVIYGLVREDVED